jgi:hypothetical protein
MGRTQSKISRPEWIRCFDQRWVASSVSDIDQRLPYASVDSVQTSTLGGDRINNGVKTTYDTNDVEDVKPYPKRAYWNPESVTGHGASAMVTPTFTQQSRR